MMRLRRKAADAAMQLNAGLVEDLADVAQAYVAFVDAVPEDEDARIVDALALAGWACDAARSATDLQLEHATGAALGPALDPQHAIALLESIAESAVVLAADGPGSPLVLTPEQVAAGLAAPALARWTHVMLDGPASAAELERADVPPTPPAGPEAVEEAHVAIRTHVPHVAARYAALLADTPEAGPAPDEVVAEALDLAHDTAVLLRRVAVAGDVRRYPEAHVYAFVVVLPAVFQSLVLIATPGEGPRRHLLEPELLRGMLEDTPHMPALLT